MAWYDTGTVSVTNGSTTVTGSGTNFVSGAQVGEGFYGPDGRLYEIQAIVSATSLTLADSYLGTTQSGQAYKIVPTQSLVANLASQVSTLISDFQTVADEAGEGKFADGSAASPGITFTQDQDTGFFRDTANEIGISIGGAKKAEFNSSGVDVTGTVTADGLTVDGTGTITNTSAGVATALSLKNNTTGVNTRVALDFLTANTKYVTLEGGYGATSPQFNLKVGNPTALVMSATSGGDISFYEDTGITPKFFWDASAEKLTVDGDGYATDLATAVTASVLELNADSGYGSAAAWFGGVTGGGQYVQSANGTGTTSYNFLINPYGGNVGIGTPSPFADTGYTSLDIRGSTGGQINFGSGASRFGQISSDTTNGLTLNTISTRPLRFFTNGTEAARIDASGNVGISINKVFGSGNGYAGNTSAASSGTLELWDTSGHVNLANNWGSGAIKFTVGVSERMRIDSSGNLGLGVVPSGWVSPALPAFDIGSAGGIAGQTNAANLHITANAYLGSGPAWKYKTSNYAGRFTVGNDAGTGGFSWYTAPSGTAGNAISFTQAMTLDASGNLLVGTTTSPSGSGQIVANGGVYLGGTVAANLLDDYEEGTWTPAFNYGTGITYTTQSGKYTKIGRMVYIEFYLSLSANDNTDTSFIHLSGLPYTPDANDTLITTLNTPECTLLKLSDADSKPSSGGRIANLADINFCGQGSTYIRYDDCNGSGDFFGAATYYASS